MMGDAERVPLMMVVRVGNAEDAAAAGLDSFGEEHPVREVKRSESVTAAVDPKLLPRTASDIKRNNDATTLAMRLLKRSMPRFVNLDEQ